MFVRAGGRLLQRVLPAWRRVGQEELVAGGGDADAAGGADAVDPVPAGGEQEEERARRLHICPVYYQPNRSGSMGRPSGSWWPSSSRRASGRPTTG